MRVELTCYEPIAVDDRNTQAWSDVWVRYRFQGKTHRYGPTLVSRAAVESDLEIHEQIRQENNKKRWHRGHDREMNRVLMAFNKGKEIVIGKDWDHGTPTIYINKDEFNRADAERMIGAMMQHLGVTGFNFAWKKRKNDLVICPVSIPPKRLREAV